MRRVLVTGAAGVIGRALLPALRAAGFTPVPFDRATDPGQEIDAGIDASIAGCLGVVHLAACARVGLCEADPELAQRDNVQATGAVVAALGSRWMVFTSSREVYGQPRAFPVGEGAAIAPINIYGRSKAAAEVLLAGARAAVVRLANVYGAPWDHADRVVPAWVRCAREGRPLCVHGVGRTVDLVHIDDVVRGLVAAALLLEGGGRPPPTLLCSGVETQLSVLARRISSNIQEVPAATHEVDRFVGDPSGALTHLGWRPRVSLDAGLAPLLSPLHSEVSP